MRTLWLPVLFCTLIGIKTIVGDLGLDTVKENLIPKDAPKDDAKQMSHHSGTMEERGRLMSRLFSDYDKRNYPTNASLQFGLALISVKIDDERHTLEAQSWLRMVWYDSRLSWDEKEYDVGVLRIPSDEIWKPDVTLYNSADHPGMVKCWASNVLAYPTGEILWVPPCHLSALCEIDTLLKEPYGQQKCHMKFGSWTFDGNSLSLSLYNGKTEADLADLWKKNSWDVMENTAALENKYYSCCTEPYPSITYNLTLQRKQNCH